MNFYERIKWVMGIMVVFLLVLATNLIDRQNFRDVRDSIEAMYADRLVAQHLLYEMSTIIHDKELAYAGLDPAALADKLTEQEDKLTAAVDRFAATRLTEQEALEFQRLQKKLRELTSLEGKLSAGKVERATVLPAVRRVRGSLHDLSAIQLREGRQQLLMGQRAIRSSDLFAQLEIGALVILALCIQAIILYRPARETTPPNA